MSGSEQWIGVNIPHPPGSPWCLQLTGVLRSPRVGRGSTPRRGTPRGCQGSASVFTALVLVAFVLFWTPVATDYRKEGVCYFVVFNCLNWNALSPLPCPPLCMLVIHERQRYDWLSLFWVSHQACRFGILRVSWLCPPSSTHSVLPCFRPPLQLARTT